MTSATHMLKNETDNDSTYLMIFLIVIIPITAATHIIENITGSFICLNNSTQNIY